MPHNETFYLKRKYEEAITELHNLWMEENKERIKRSRFLQQVFEAYIDEWMFHADKENSIYKRFMQPLIEKEKKRVVGQPYSDPKQVAPELISWELECLEQWKTREILTWNDFKNLDLSQEPKLQDMINLVKKDLLDSISIPNRYNEYRLTLLGRAILNLEK